MQFTALFAATVAFVAYLPAALSTTVSAVAYPTVRMNQTLRRPADTALDQTTCSGSSIASFTLGPTGCAQTSGAHALSIVNATAGCQVFIFSDSECIRHTRQMLIRVCAAACTGADFVNLVNLGETCHK